MKHEHSHEGHSHTGHNHSHGGSTRNLGIAFFLNLGFAIIEIIGGLWTNSVAIISDAVHDFGDAFSIGVSFFLERFSEKKRTRTFTYGYKRFSTLGALINSIVLLVGSIFIFMETIPRLFHPAHLPAVAVFILLYPIFYKNASRKISRFFFAMRQNKKTIDSTPLCWDD